MDSIEGSDNASAQQGAALTDEQVDEAIHEYLVRVAQRKPVSGDDYRWAAEGKRRVRDLDTLRDWIGGK